MQKSEIILYQPDDKSIHLNVRIEGDTVWLNQAQMAELLQTTSQNITLHIGNIYKEKELTMESTCKDFLQVQIEKNRQVTRKIKHYNLDVITVSYTHLRAHETVLDLVCRLLLEKKNTTQQ